MNNEKNLRWALQNFLKRVFVDPDLLIGWKNIHFLALIGVVTRVALAADENILFSILLAVPETPYGERFIVVYKVLALAHSISAASTLSLYKHERFHYNLFQTYSFIRVELYQKQIRLQGKTENFRLHSNGTWKDMIYIRNLQ